jgi:hypothetical protein
MSDLATYIRISEVIPSWARGEEPEELARLSLSLNAAAVLVEGKRIRPEKLPSDSR